ncbi:MAG: hypothetical protein EOP34_09450, partial [Rickettsiales bacterium]
MFQSIIEPTILMLYAYLNQVFFENSSSAKLSEYFGTVFVYYIFLRIIITIPALLFSYLLLMAFLSKEKLYNLNFIMIFYLAVTVLITSVFIFIDSSTVHPIIIINITLISFAVVLLVASQKKKL